MPYKILVRTCPSVSNALWVKMSAIGWGGGVMSESERDGGMRGEGEKERAGKKERRREREREKRRGEGERGEKRVWVPTP